MKISKEFKAAMLALVGIAFLYWGFNFMKGRDIFSNSRTFYVVYHHVGGLTKGTSITLNGLNIGKITDISFMDNSGKLLVTLEITSDFQFSKNSKAVIYESSFIGGKALALQISKDDAPAAQSGDTLKAGFQRGLKESIEDALVPLQDKIESAIVHVDSIVINLNKMLDEDNMQNFAASLKNINTTTKNLGEATRSLNNLLADNDQKINASLANVEQFTANMVAVSDQLKKSDIDQLMANLKSTSQTLNSVMNKMDRGEGSMGKLINDPKLYDNLQRASKELELLLADLKNNPKRYVHFSLLGKKASGYEGVSEDQNLKD